jgi:carbonic anhydrase
MFRSLLAAGLTLTLQAQSHEEPPAVHPPPKKHVIAVPEPPPAEGEAAKHAPKAAAKPSSKPPARKQVPVLSEEARRLAEAEAIAAKLLENNARLQQEMAKVLGAPFKPIETPEAAMGELQAGNGRFTAGRRVRTLLSLQDTDLRATLAKGQAPFAVIVTCSDSRLADNLLFDQELGRLFTIREAGNSPDIQGLASVEYAVEHLGSRLVVVLGHTGCGAVKAVQEAHGHPLPGNLWSLQAAMAGLLEAVHEDPNESPAEHRARLEAVNAQRQAQSILDRSEIVRHRVSSGKLKVVPALYELTSGQVRFLELPKAVAPTSH